jgi:peptide/nickel transport system substrate-binding protein
MAERDSSRRWFLQNAAYAGAGAIVLSSCTTGQGGSGGGQGGKAGALAPIQGSEVILDPAEFPTTFKEWPEFAKKVAAGQLPPVAERIGRDPLVIKPLDGIGKYGGQIRRGFVDATDARNGIIFCGGPDCLLYWDYQGKNVIPNVARNFELSDGDRVLTMHLRRGMKWSDGTPFTADDITFWREDINLHADLGGTGTSALRAGNKDVVVQKIDDHTVQFVSAVSNSILAELFASSDDLGGLSRGGQVLTGGYAPKHYLSKFHPKYTSMSAANKLAKDAGFDDWTAHFRNRMLWEQNVELPVLSPWIVTRPINRPPWEFTANPYSIWVDVEGNQLPYVPKVTLSNAESQEVFNLRAVAGQYDFQDRGLSVASLPVLVRNQERSKYTLHRAPSEAMEFGVRINLSYTMDEVVGELLRNVDFRRALSLGVDRDQINQTMALGTSKASATMAADNSPYFPGPEWRSKWATLDRAQANALLDKVGLTKRDGAGYRMRPDGKERLTLDYQSTLSLGDFPAMGEMIKRQWQQIGIFLDVQKVAPELIVERSLANEVALNGFLVGTEDPFLRPDFMLPTSTVGFPGLIGMPYAKWFASGGRTGTEPPESLEPLRQAMAMYQQGLRSSRVERAKLGKEIFKLHADQVWSIGIFGFGLMLVGLYIANNKLTNVPDRIVNSLVTRAPSNLLPMTFYYK